jgi:glycosyltransferase involved in cell wall biosynthesis
MKISDGESPAESGACSPGERSAAASDAPMTILSIAFPLLPVCESSAGGAERILYLLERQFVNLHYQSIVIAAAGSRVSGCLLAGPAANGEITDAVRREAHIIHRQLIEEALDHYSVDIVHFHGLDFHSYAPVEYGKAKALATLHLPIDWYPDAIFAMPAIHFNCVSSTQAGSKPDRVLPVVQNGIEVSRYQHRARKKNGERVLEELQAHQQRRRGYLLLISRICPEKGVDIALRLAHRHNLPLVIAGPVHPFRDHQRYFSEKVEPLLDSKRVYIGPVDLEQKVALLNDARCLLVPSLAAETSSLVAMEACSAGTPVVAFRSGALPEVVKDGETGFIVDGEDEMAEAVLRTESISSDVCRSYAAETFNAERMASDYLKLYRDILQS